MLSNAPRLRLVASLSTGQNDCLEPDKMIVAAQPAERLSAFLDAATRRDLSEMDRLNETCPRKTYVKDDAAYTTGKNVLWRLAATVQIEVNRYATGAIAALAMLVRGPEYELERAQARESFCVLLSRMKGCLDGWNGFCEEIGIEGETALTAFGLNARERFRTMCLAVELDPGDYDLDGDDETRTAIFDLCKHLWRRVAE